MFFLKILLFLALAAFSRAEPFVQLDRGNFEQHFCEIILNFIENLELPNWIRLERDNCTDSSIDIVRVYQNLVTSRRWC